MVESVRRNPHALASLLRLRQSDDSTFTHSVNTCVLSVMLAEQCGLLTEEVEATGLGGLVHDLGKLTISPEVLNKPGPFTEEEWQLLRGHPLAGLDLIHRNSDLQVSIVESITQHHEHVDGTGYPYGLRGETIGKAARIVSIVDMYEGMTSHRPHRPALPAAEAAQWILINARRLFDPELVSFFIRAVGVYPIGSLVRLNTGELAVVFDFDADSLLRPMLLLITDAWGAPLATPALLDLSDRSPSAAKRGIVRAEDPTAFGIDIESCLSLPATPAGCDMLGIDSRV